MYSRNKVTSVYLPETVNRMMPENYFSLFSLEPQRANLALTFAAKLSKQGAMEEYRIFPSIIKKVLPPPPAYFKAPFLFPLFRDLGGPGPQRQEDGQLNTWCKHLISEYQGWKAALKQSHGSALIWYLLFMWPYFGNFLIFHDR